MVAVPSAMPLTSPVVSTAATAPLLVVHVTARPERGLPLASFTVATSRALAPTYTLAGLGLTVTEATGRFATLTFFLPFFPSLVAVIVADPTPTPLSRPLGDTVATALLLVSHVTVRPVSTFPLASLATAVSCCVEPSAIFTESGLTMTGYTGAPEALQTTLKATESPVLRRP